MCICYIGPKQCSWASCILNSVMATFDCLSKIIKITNYRQNDFKKGANLMFPLYACYYQNNRNINRFNITRVLNLLNNEMLIWINANIKYKIVPMNKVESLNLKLQFFCKS